MRRLRHWFGIAAATAAFIALMLPFGVFAYTWLVGTPTDFWRGVGTAALCEGWIKWWRWLHA
jgi:hypothetical protein